MRFLLSLALAAACVSVAHASTIRDDFTYTYVLAGNTYVTTFSLINGQATSQPVTPVVGVDAVYTYEGVALNGNAASRATVQFTPGYVNRPIYGYALETFDFHVFAENMPEFVDSNIGADSSGLDLSGSTLGFHPGVYQFTYGSVDVMGTPAMFFQGSSLAITQTVLADPTPTPTPAPVAVTPEPGTLALLGTGLLGVAAAARRRLLPALSLSQGRHLNTTGQQALWS